MAPPTRASICPICRGPVPEGARTFPFCTERCRMIDLGNWLDERYVVPERADEDTLPGMPAGVPGRVPPSRRSDEDDEGGGGLLH